MIPSFQCFSLFIIHREHPAARFFKYEDVKKAVIGIVHFIRANGKTQRRLRNFIEELEFEDKPSDASLYSIVKRLSTSIVLSRFVNLFEFVITFLQENNRSYPQLENDKLMEDLMMFVTDIMNYL